MAENNDDDLSRPPLDEFLDMKDWDPEMKEWYRGCNSVRLLAVGRSGVGKSTFINAMFREDVADVALLRDPTTMKVEGYKQSINGITLHIFDSPGVQDGKNSDDKYTEDMRQSCKMVNLLLYCMRMDCQIHKDDYTAMELVSRALGKDIWKNTVFVLTQANQVKPMTKKHGTPKENFNRIFNGMKGVIQKHVENTYGVVAIPVVATGSPMDLQLPVCDDWRNEVLLKCLEKCSDEGAIAILKSNWGKFAGGAAAVAGVTGVAAAGTAAGTAAYGTIVGVSAAALLLGPPGWIAGGSILGLTAIASAIGAIAVVKYKKHKRSIEEVKSELGSAAKPK